MPKAEVDPTVSSGRSCWLGQVAIEYRTGTGGSANVRDEDNGALLIQFAQWYIGEGRQILRTR